MIGKYRQELAMLLVKGGPFNLSRFLAMIDRRALDKALAHLALSPCQCGKYTNSLGETVSCPFCDARALVSSSTQPAASAPAPGPAGAQGEVSEAQAASAPAHGDGVVGLDARDEDGNKGST